ncbi:unnamed protein product, partial [Symbiodinium necroappetens]
TWTSADKLNKLAAVGRDSPAGSLQIVGGAVVAAEEKKSWESRHVMAVLDGLEAIRLAWVLTGLGAEEDVDAYISWGDKKVRARNVNIVALVQYWTSTATTLAMEMRQRRTFKEVTSGVMSDISAFLEAMAAPPPRPEPKGKTKPQPPNRRELDTATVDPPPPPPPKKFKGEKGKKGRPMGELVRPLLGRLLGGLVVGERRQPRLVVQFGRPWPMPEDRREASRPMAVALGQHVAGAAASEPDQPLAKRPRLSTNRPRDIILLSAFDGIGAAPYIVDRDFGRPRLAVSWEVDRACKALVQQAMPWVEHRGDLTRDSPKDVADLVLEADPNAEAMVLWCAAPPCQDFSRIAKGAGHQTERGRLFEDSVAFMDELRSVLRQHRFAFLYENVEMDAEAAKVSSDALGVSPVFVCPSDFGWVSRPRLWWLSVEWSRVVTDPADGSPLEWAKRGRWDRLRLTAALSAADSFELGGGLQFHSSVAQGRKLMPCATTPAHGRRAAKAALHQGAYASRRRRPLGGRGPPVRPLAVEAMLQEFRGVHHIPPPDVKEQLHHIPAGYTATAGAVWSRRGWDFSPPPTPALLGAGLDEDAHWAAATGGPPVSPEWRHDLVRIRAEVLRELQEMVDDAAEDTTAWLATLPPHVRATYETSDRPRPFQGPIFDRLLGDLGYPATDDLRQDVTEGFDMLGRVRAAPGWKPRSDERYARPKKLDRLRRENRQY